MPSKRRLVQIAAGHIVRVRRLPRIAARPGYVVVEKSNRPPFEIPETRWKDAQPA